MAILRKANKRRFEIIDHELIRDNRLSLKALGLLVKLLSLPDNWEFSENGVAYAFGVSRNIIRPILKELEQSGYLVREQTRSKKGVFGAADWTIYEKPPLVEKPLVEKPTSVNRTQYNTDIYNTEKYSTDNTLIGGGYSTYDSMPENPSPPSPLSVDFTYKQAVALYRQYSPTLYSKEFDKGLNDDYKNAQTLFLAIDEGFTISDAEQLFKRAEASAWLTAEAKNITFEWLLKKRKLVINGKYDNSEPKEKTDSKQEKYGVTRRLF